METFALGQELINNSAIPASVFAASVGGRRGPCCQKHAQTAADSLSNAAPRNPPLGLDEGPSAVIQH